jgi:hypothetical protein
MINFLFGLLLGFIIGVVLKTILKPRNLPKDFIDEALAEFKKEDKGEVIVINKVEQYVKDNPGVSLQDVINLE